MIYAFEFLVREEFINDKVLTLLFSIAFGKFSAISGVRPTSLRRRDRIYLAP
jgi:hypothetical protein